MPKRKQTKKAVDLHPVAPLPSMLIRLHQLRRGTYATDFGLNAIFAAPTAVRSFTTHQDTR